MNFGGKEVLGVYLGDDPVDALYLGDELVWSGDTAGDEDEDEPE